MPERFLSLSRVIHSPLLMILENAEKGYKTPGHASLEKIGSIAATILQNAC